MGIITEIITKRLAHYELTPTIINVVANEIASKTYSADEVKSIVQMIYSEFAESPLNQHTTQQLKRIIELEVEQRPIKPIKIFK